QSRTCLTAQRASLSRRWRAAGVHAYAYTGGAGVQYRLAATRRVSRASSWSSDVWMEGGGNPRPSIRRHGNANYGAMGETRRWAVEEGVVRSCLAVFVSSSLAPLPPPAN